MQNASRTYPTDLSDAQWNQLQPLLPPPSRRGRPRTRDLRSILDGIFYLLQAGCAWRLLPTEFGPWSTDISVAPTFGRKPERASAIICPQPTYP